MWTKVYCGWHRTRLASTVNFIWFTNNKTVEVLPLQPQKTPKTIIFTHLWGYRLLHFPARQCTSTHRLQGGWVFESWDAWFHAPVLLSADTINVFRQQTRLSLLSKQSSNWQHQSRQASLYLRQKISCKFITIWLSYRRKKKGAFLNEMQCSL